MDVLYLTRSALISILAIFKGNAFVGLLLLLLFVSTKHCCDANACNFVLHISEHVPPRRAGSNCMFLNVNKCPLNVDLKILRLGIPLVVQWLRLYLLMQRVWVTSLVRELRSHMPRGQKPKT